MHAMIRLLFNCEHCGKCCKISRTYSETDVDRIEAHTGETREQIDSKLGEKTCGYLLNNVCTIHLVKPTVCVWYPGPAPECPGYNRLLSEFGPDAMRKICNTPELTLLYFKCVVHGDKGAAMELLQRLKRC